MESRSPYPNHHTGYAASRPHQPPPLPPAFSDNPNFYGPYRPNLVAPLLRPPPPPYRAVPTPPTSYNHSPNPQFTYNNPNNDYHRRSGFLQSPPRVLLRPPPPPLEDGFPPRLSQLEGYSKDPPPQPRVHSHNWPGRPYPADDFDPDSYHRQFNKRPMSPIANIRHELDCNISSRVMEERIVGDKSHQFRNQFGVSSDRLSRGYRVSDHGLVSRVFDSKSGNYDNQGAFPCGRDRKFMRDVRDPLMEIGSNGIDDRKGIWVFAGKREHFRSREANTELERHSGKRSREGSHEFNWNHRKQMPKRSAFLRIQKPSYKNREDDMVGFSGYFDNSKSNSFGAKDQNLHSGCGSGGEVREGSPVELDVSFKSNSLVAKAIVTAPSSSGISEIDMTPRKSKIRKVLVPNKDRLSSSSCNKDNVKLDSSGPNKNSVKLDSSSPNKDSVKLDSSPCVPNNAPSCEEGLNSSKERLVSSLFSKGNKSSSVPGSSGTNVSPAKSKMESSDGCILSDKDGTDVVSGEMSPVKVMKKKKVVKRVVKRAASSSLTSSSSQLTKKFDEHVRDGSSACCLPVTSEPDKASDMASIDEVDHQNSSNEVAVMPECGKTEGANSTVSEQVATVSGSDDLCELNSIRKRRCSTSPASSSKEETDFHGSLLNINLHAASNVDKESFKSQNKISNPAIGSVTEPQNVDSFMPEENSAKGSPEVLPPTEGNFGSDSFSFAKSKTQEASSTSHDTAVGLGNSFLDSQERIVDIESRNVCSQQPCTDPGCPLVEKGSLGQFASVNVPAGSSQMLHKSNSGETSIQNFLANVDCSNHGVGIGCDNGCTSSDRLEFDSHETVDDIGKWSSPNGSSMSAKKVSTRAYLNTGVSVGCNEQDTFNFESNSKIFEMPQLDSSKSVINKACMGPLNDDWVDTTLRLSFKDSSPAEGRVSGDGCADLGLQPCADVTVDSHQYNLGKISDIKASVSSRDDISPDGPSPRDQKKRKFSALQLEVFGPTASNIGGRPIIAGLSASACDAAFNTVDDLEKQEEITASRMDSPCDSELPPLQKGITALSDTFSRGRDLENAVTVRDGFQDYGSKRVHCSSVVRELAVTQEQSTCRDLIGEQVVNATPVVDGGSNQNVSMDIGSAEGGTMDLEAAEEQPSTESRTALCQGSSELQSLDRDERVPKTDIENESWGSSKNDLPFTLNDLCSCGDGNGVPTNNSGTEIVPDVPSDMDSPESLPDVVGRLLSQNTSVKASSVGKIPLEKQASEHGCCLTTHLSSSRDPNLHVTVNNMGDKSSLTKNTELLSAEETKSSSALDAIGGELNGRKIPSHHVVSKVYPGHASLVSFASKNRSSSAHITKPRTWHRTYNHSTSASHRNKTFSNSVSTQRQFLRKIPKSQSTSYVRKGNSLVRQTTSAAVRSRDSHGLSSVNQLNSLGMDEVKKNFGTDSSTDVVDPTNVMRTGGINTSFERPRNHPLPSAPKIPNHKNKLLVDCRSSPLPQTCHCDPTENASELTEPGETKSAAKSSEDMLKISEALSQHGEINNLEQSGLNNGNLLSSNVASMTYVKRNSNQLVASSNPRALSGHNTPAVVSDSYYKRRENQLIRTSAETPFMQTINFFDDLNSEGRTATRSFSKRRLQKVEPKTWKLSKFSLVWTLRDAETSNNDGNSLCYKKLLPQLFPWKRGTRWRNFGPNLASNSANSSLSTIGKLLLLRNRNAVYTRSLCGFSLRKSKVLSVGGCSLKWSKSIERRSKKANEEATLAVAAAERKKREQSGATSVVSGTKNKRERIFRIGSVRYKMDSSRRTLQRVSDDESSLIAVDQMEKDGKKPYVPRRLIIGKDEYVRIGNGNQLIRNPKKRTRILASEKVRWSLHTARSRLARKRKYCQFFTRFGKCNKDDGKCPYIHDSSKIAVCTKFLNGQCSSSDCKLTHKIIPERMPDCSYFLQGLCTNKNCPYRHVHVNPSASTCDGFLRGYCAEGNECRKKHSYVCPMYEATGSCSQGSRCKLHHPKRRSKGKKGRRLQHKNSRGRYFGSIRIHASEPGTVVSEKLSALDGDSIFAGDIGDYISLDVSGEETREGPTDDERTFSDSDPSDLPSDDLDKFTKPLRIMDIW
uniref:Uncharacterized protein At1g21580 isoform X2 n=1 Tax=Rhizophora mucronata TaxID=61149 RepID=A0A2P2JZN5_RHIMU